MTEACIASHHLKYTHKRFLAQIRGLRCGRHTRAQLFLNQLSKVCDEMILSLSVAIFETLQIRRIKGLELQLVTPRLTLQVRNILHCGGQS
jgi:hypothetical protein